MTDDGHCASSLSCPYSASSRMTAMTLSSASLLSIMRSPPIGIACISRSPWPIDFSVSTHTSIGSPAPMIPARPVRSRQKAPTRSAHSVRGRKPYNDGQTFEKRCGRSTFSRPVALSISYLTVSVGTISMYAVTIWGAWAPSSTPCQGCARKADGKIVGMMAEGGDWGLGTGDSAEKAGILARSASHQSPVPSHFSLVMIDLKSYIRNVPDFPQPGILFRDIAPLLRQAFDETIEALSTLLDAREWSQVDAVAGVESRGFILAAALALRHGKGFVLVRKKGKLPPPVVELAYGLEYGTGVLEMQAGSGRLLLVDDVLATGGTLMASAALAERAGYSVSQSIVLVDLKLDPPFRWDRQPLRALLTY